MDHTSYVREHMVGKATEELLSILDKHDNNIYTEETFHIITDILSQRNVNHDRLYTNGMDAGPTGNAPTIKHIQKPKFLLREAIVYPDIQVIIMLFLGAPILAFAYIKGGLIPSNNEAIIICAVISAISLLVNIIRKRMLPGVAVYFVLSILLGYLLHLPPLLFIGLFAASFIPAAMSILFSVIPSFLYWLVRKKPLTFGFVLSWLFWSFYLFITCAASLEYNRFRF